MTFVHVLSIEILTVNQSLNFREIIISKTNRDNFNIYIIKYENNR